MGAGVLKNFSLVFVKAMCFYTQVIGITVKLQLPGAMLCWVLFRWERQTTCVHHCSCLQPGGVTCKPFLDDLSFLTKPHFIHSTQLSKEHQFSPET